MNGNQQSTDLAFEAWVSHVFDQSIEDSAHYSMDEYTPEPSPVTAVQYLTRVFESADTTLDRFADEPLNQALWEMLNDVSSNSMSALLADDVPWPVRQECIRSIGDLFERLFAERCSQHLSYKDEPEANPLNLVCYMWWDIFPTWGDPDNASCLERDTEILQVMQRILSLDCMACQESALHGLGHWQMHYPEQTQRMIDDYLQRHGRLRAELKDYAMAARRGYVQ
ncbi:hypothetical protein LCGC14_3081030 [marine sediment metagenome]|uniref:Uncharacterized protein n=1 Tax=marine sediment metagenome TaxID=412755 RepID=A0A0F8WD83_9ZZZZ